jgi:glycyl-tRNA synthetase beta chain
MQMALLLTPKLFAHEAESALLGAVVSVGEALAPLLLKRDYQSALDQLAQLRGPVDTFFDGVMVNAEGPR